MKEVLSWLRLEFLLLGLVAAVAVTWPLVLDLTHQMPGSELVGAYSHVWKAWWTGQALVELHTNPAYSPIVNVPQGLEVGFYLAGFGDELLVLPVTRLFGPVAAFNTIVLLTTATGCWAASLLATWSGLRTLPAALVGLAWSLAPHHLGFVMGGAIENLANPWIPLFFLALLWLLGVRPASEDGAPPDPQPPSRPRVVLAVATLALCLFLSGMTAWFSANLLGLYAGLVLVGALVLQRRRALPGVLWAGLGLVLGSVLVVLAARLLLPVPAAAEEFMPALQLNTDNAAFLDMGWKRDLPEEVVYRSETLWLNHHVLLTLGALAVAGLFSRRGRLWALLAAPFLVDAFLPNGLFQGLVLPASQAPSVLYTALHTILSGASRRLFPMNLMLALAAGHGVAWLTWRLRRSRLGRLTPALALTAWLAESVLGGPIKLPVPVFTVEVPAYVAHLRGAGEGGVVDLPLMVSCQGWPSPDPLEIKAVRSRYMFLQTQHGLPVLTSVGSRMGFELDDLPLSDPLFQATACRSGQRRRTAPASLDAWDPSHLRQAGFRWLVLHQVGHQPQLASRLARELRPRLGQPLSFPDGVFVFDLGTAADTPGAP